MEWHLFDCACIEMSVVGQDQNIRFLKKENPPSKKHLGAFNCQICLLNDYLGKDCSTKSNRCLSKRCINGRCTTDGCQCEQGWTGLTCENVTCPITNCTTNPRKCDQRCNIPECDFNNFICSLGVEPYKKCPIKMCNLKSTNQICDPECDIEDCNFDGGDCRKSVKCPLDVFCRSVYNNTRCNQECDNMECGFDNMACKKRLPEKLASFTITLKTQLHLLLFTENTNIF